MKRLSSARISQIVFFAVFLILFATTEYRGSDQVNLALNSFFRADPLVVVSYLLSAKAWYSLLLPAFLLLALSALLGRFFCGWICPLGTILDFFAHRVKRTLPLRFLQGNLKYYILLTLLFAALFGVNLAGLVDPLAILLRFLTFSLYPLIGFLAKEGWVDLYRIIGDSRDSLEGGYIFLRSYVLPFRDTFFPLAFFSLFLFMGILFLERFERRNWCRNLCPLGTLLGIVSQLSLFKRLPSKLCADCGDCKSHCPTGFDTDILQKSDCILCMDCRLKCGSHRVRFRPGVTPSTKMPFQPERRVFVTSVVTGLFASQVFTNRTPSSASSLLRPPGAQNEQDFLKKCVRCGECMKVCLRNALYPAGLQAGLSALYTPTVVPRLGYCEYNCNLCGQVCPTGAIPKLPLDEKKKAVLGTAVFDKNHCLPYERKLNCMVCEEHCPIAEKAIRFEEVTETDSKGNRFVLKRPYVVDDLCIGCGICEYVCPVEEKAGVAVFKKTKRKI
jgi:MauM/NapG family ferredoxin protein